MKVLVTGGAGFIGSHLVKLLANGGINVRVLDSLIHGQKEGLPKAVEFIQGDIRDSDAVKHAMQDITHIVHLAALVSVTESMTDPVSTNNVNVAGTENVLFSARESGAMRFVYATSAAVYGDEPSLPKKESSPLRPLSPYAVSKVINELQSDMYNRVFGLSTIGLRFFNVYGLGQSGNHPYASVIPRWIEMLKKEKSITIYGDGSQTRDFVHVRDVAEAIYSALMSDATGVFNVASGKETSLNDLLLIIKNKYPKQFEIKNETARAGDILRSVADISESKRALSFKPTIEITNGIEELLIS
ncbi:NAD-dependent epimerase/dehydratase family protein [Candidatus Kaiserbacteria bacterium]|nr:NAD-dependent epimerase/dehydratase family protein [Candidatus Kaiserbacteria bacterium]